VLGVADAPVDGLHDGTGGKLARLLYSDNSVYEQWVGKTYACHGSTSRVVRMTFALG
jgi:hypothetical protein